MDSFWALQRNKVLEYGSLWALVLEYGPEVIIFFHDSCISRMCTALGVTSSCELNLLENSHFGIDLCKQFSFKMTTSCGSFACPYSFISRHLQFLKTAMLHTALLVSSLVKTEILMAGRTCQVPHKHGCRFKGGGWEDISPHFLGRGDDQCYHPPTFS